MAVDEVPPSSAQPVSHQTSYSEAHDYQQPQLRQRKQHEPQQQPQTLTTPQSPALTPVADEKPKKVAQPQPSTTTDPKQTCPDLSSPNRADAQQGQAQPVRAETTPGKARPNTNTHPNPMPTPSPPPTCKKGSVERVLLCRGSFFSQCGSVTSRAYCSKDTECYRRLTNLALPLDACYLVPPGKSKEKRNGRNRKYFSTTGGQSFEYREYQLDVLKEYEKKYSSMMLFQPSAASTIKEDVELQHELKVGSMFRVTPDLIQNGENVIRFNWCTAHHYLYPANMTIVVRQQDPVRPGDPTCVKCSEKRLQKRLDKVRGMLSAAAVTNMHNPSPFPLMSFFPPFPQLGPHLFPSVPLVGPPTTPNSPLGMFALPAPPFPPILPSSALCPPRGKLASLSVHHRNENNSHYSDLNLNRNSQQQQQQHQASSSGAGQMQKDRPALSTISPPTRALSLPEHPDNTGRTTPAHSHPSHKAQQPQQQEIPVNSFAPAGAAMENGQSHVSVTPQPTLPAFFPLAMPSGPANSNPFPFDFSAPGAFGPMNMEIMRQNMALGRLGPAMQAASSTASNKTTLVKVETPLTNLAPAPVALKKEPAEELSISGVETVQEQRELTVSPESVGHLWTPGEEDLYLCDDLGPLRFDSLRLTMQQNSNNSGNNNNNSSSSSIPSSVKTERLLDLKLGPDKQLDKWDKYNWGGERESRETMSFPRRQAWYDEGWLDHNVTDLSLVQDGGLGADEEAVYRDRRLHLTLTLTTLMSSELMKMQLCRD
eukprot:g22285.t1